MLEPQSQLRPVAPATPRTVGLALLIVVTAGGLACTGRIGTSSNASGDQNPGENQSPTQEPAAPPFQPLTSLVRRLSQDEYVYTVQDVLGIVLTNDERSQLPNDRPLAGFARTAVGQTTLPDHVLAYAELARALVEKTGFADFISAHATCRNLERRCAEDFVRSAGLRLFRRPIASAELAVYADLFETVAAENDFDRSIRAIAEAMLQAPSFLYLLEEETAGERRSEGYSLATRLSYALWSSAPDDALYSAVEAGELAAPESLAQQVRRMLSVSEKVARGRGRFLTDWARLESLPDDDGLRADLIEAAQAFYDAHVENDASLFGIFDTPSAVLTPALAQAWGLPSAGPGLRTYDTTGLAGRRGLLAQPGIVAGMTNADGGAIVARGLFLQAQLFCSEPPDPPASLQETIDEFIAEQPQDASQRQIADVRLERTGCRNCHAQFDPLAFGFEHFDFRGRYRTVDEFDNAIRTDGWIPGVLTGQDNQPYADFEAYMVALSSAVQVQRCWVQRHLEYLLGRRLGPDQQEAVRELTEATVAGGGRLEALILAAVVHPIFATAKSEGN